MFHNKYISQIQRMQSITLNVSLGAAVTFKQPTQNVMLMCSHRLRLEVPFKRSFNAAKNEQHRIWRIHSAQVAKTSLFTRPKLGVMSPLLTGSALTRLVALVLIRFYRDAGLPLTPALIHRQYSCSAQHQTTMGNQEPARPAV